MKIHSVATFALLALASSSPLEAQCELQSFSASDGAVGSRFGSTLAVNQDWLIVGAPYDEPVGPFSGSAYVFERRDSGWAEVQKLLPSQLGSSDFFGWDVALSGIRAIVSASWQDGTAGAVFAFEYDGTSWLETQRFQPLDSAPGSFFGIDLEIDGGRAFVGSPGTAAGNSGAVYEFLFNGGSWVETEKIETNDPDLNLFGSRIAVDGSRMLVTANEIVMGVSIERVLVYEEQGGTWTETARLAPANEVRLAALDLHGDLALLGDVLKGGAGVGAAWVFEFDGTTWSETLAFQPAGTSFVGGSGCISDSHVAIGAAWDSTADLSAGAFFLFERGPTGLSPATKIFAAPPVPQSSLGSSLLFADGTILAGASNANVTGSVHVFDLDDSTDSYCTAKTDAGGCLPQIESTGVPSLTAPGFDIAVPSVLNSVAGLMFYGQDAASVPFLGGTLCVMPPLARTGLQFSGGTPPGQGIDCSGSYSFAMSAELQTSPVFGPGDVGYAQYWYRDSAGATGVGLSNGLAFEVCP